ncbi:MAG: chemotaxis protein CheX [Planctomycetota bacterium]
MQAHMQEITRFTESIWSTMLGFMVQAQVGSSERELSEVSDHEVVASVAIAGAWNGSVAVVCSENLARRAAGALFEKPFGEVTLEELSDAMGELANMIGGNLKSLLPAPSHLETPWMACTRRGARFLPEQAIITQAAFECDGAGFRVYLLKPSS